MGQERGGQGERARGEGRQRETHTQVRGEDEGRRGPRGRGKYLSTGVLSRTPKAACE